MISFSFSLFFDAIEFFSAQLLLNAQPLQVVRLTADALVDLAVLADCFLARLKTVVHPDKQANIKIHSQGNHRLN